MTHAIPVEPATAERLPNMKALATVVCCVEAGGLEDSTLRMVESLRRWGGAFAECPVMAVTPRFGPPLRPATRRRFAELGVEYLRPPRTAPYAWLGFLNKPLALALAAERAPTEQMIWLDSDILVAGEPTGLALGPEEDFAACAPDKNIGSSGPADEHEPYWQQTAALFGLKPEAMPWVTAIHENVPIRLYWNSGVFSFRRNTRFAQAYLDGCFKVLESRVASHASGIFFTDQVALGLVVLAEKLRWRALPYSHNWAMGSKIKDRYDPDLLRAARLLHYHDAMWPEQFGWFLDCLRRDRPELAAWLAPQGPLRVRLAPHWKVLRKALNAWRERKVKAYEAGCRTV